MKTPRLFFAAVLGLHIPSAFALSPSPHVSCCMNYGEGGQFATARTEVPARCQGFDLKKETCDALLEQFRQSTPVLVPKRDADSKKPKAADRAAPTPQPDGKR